MKSSVSSSHISLLAHCVVKLPPRSGVSFVESRLPNALGQYEVVFREEASGEVDSIIVPKEMVYMAVASGDSTDLLAHVTSRYAILFRKSIMGDQGGQDQTLPA